MFNREAPLEEGILDPLLPEPEPEWSPLKPPLEGGFGGLGGLFMGLDIFGGAPLGILKSEDLVRFHRHSGLCYERVLLLFRVLLIYLFNLPPKRGWESRGICLRGSLWFFRKNLRSTDYCLLPDLCKIAAISTDKPTEWCIDLARAWRNLVRCAESVSSDKKDWKAAEENKSAWEVIATRLLTCFSMVSRFFDDMVTGEGLERSNLDASESNSGKEDVDSVSPKVL